MVWGFPVLGYQSPVCEDEKEGGASVGRRGRDVPLEKVVTFPSMAGPTTCREMPDVSLKSAPMTERVPTRCVCRRGRDVRRQPVEEGDIECLVPRHAKRDCGVVELSRRYIRTGFRLPACLPACPGIEEVGPLGARDDHLPGRRCQITVHKRHSRPRRCHRFSPCRVPGAVVVAAGLDPRA